MIVISFLLCCLGVAFIFKFSPPSINKINNITFNIYLYYLILSIVGAFIITWSDSAFDIPSYYINSNKRICAISHSYKLCNLLRKFIFFHDDT